MLLSNRIDDGEVATLLVTELPRVVPRGSPRVQLVRTDTHCIMIIIPHLGIAHGHVARAYHAMKHHILSVKLVEMLPLLRHPIRLSGDRRVIDPCQARAGGFRIIDARGRVLCVPVQIRDRRGRRLFGEAVSFLWCSRDKRLLVNAKQRDATDE